jgi:hypothetical protein
MALPLLYEIANFSILDRLHVIQSISFLYQTTGFYPRNTRVSGPTAPSTLMPQGVCKATTAALVMFPYTPSGFATVYS